LRWPAASPPTFNGRSPSCIPAAWRADVGPSSPVEGVWWRNFHDSTLNRYVDQALRYNSDVLIARERVNEYQARAYAADSSLFPSLDAGLTGTAPVRSPPPPACRPQHGVQRRADRQL
jgi:outer membrane protein TolC